MFETFPGGVLSGFGMPLPANDGQTVVLFDIRLVPTGRGGKRKSLQAGKLEGMGLFV